MTFRRVVSCALAALALSACKSRIQHGLDERQANELQTVLAERGLEATKVAEEGKKPSWALEVDDERASDAVRIVSELGLPRPRPEGFGEVFGKGSLVPTPTEERALFLQALSGELARTLESVEGVVSARVHLVLPPARGVGASQPPTSGAKASALLRVRPGSAPRIQALQEELRALIAGSVEGLGADGVTLVLNEVSTQIARPPTAESPLPRLRALLLAMAAALCLLALLLLGLTFKLRQYRQAAAAARVPPPALAKPVIAPGVARKVA